jgi:hypothetical protein
MQREPDPRAAISFWVTTVFCSDSTSRTRRQHFRYRRPSLAHATSCWQRLSWPWACRSMSRGASSCPCPMLCQYCISRCRCLWIHRALADENIAGRSRLFHRHDKQIGTCLGSHPESLCRSHEVIVGIDQVHAGQFVAVALENSLDCEPTRLQRKPGVLREEVARCAVERGSVRPVLANSKARSRKPASCAAANHRPGAPLDRAKSKRIFFGS